MTREKRLEVLAELQRQGLLFGECISEFGVDCYENPYAIAAKHKYLSEGQVEFDGDTVVSVSDDPGAYVLAWVWVTDEEAGIVREYE